MFDHLPSTQWLFIFCIPLAGAVAAYVANSLVSLLTYGTTSSSQWGLIHFKHHFFIKQLYRQLLHDQISSAHLYEHMGPEKMVKQIVQGIKPHLDSIIDDAMGEDHDIFWENLPITVKNRFYGRAHKMLPRIIDDIVEDIGDNIERLTNLEEIIEKKLTSRNLSVAWIIKQSYIDDIKKLPLWGILVGYLLGLGLLATWLIIPHWIVLIGGVSIITTAATWLSHSYLSQYNLNAKTLSNLLVTQPLSPSSIIEALLAGSRGKYARSLIKKHSAPIIEQTSLRAFAQLTIGPRGYAAVKHQLAKNMSDAYLHALNDERFNGDQCQRIESYLTRNFKNTDVQSATFMKQVHKLQMQFMLPIAMLVGSFAGLTLQLFIWSP